MLYLGRGNISEGDQFQLNAVAGAQEPGLPRRLCAISLEIISEHAKLSEIGQILRHY